MVAVLVVVYAVPRPLLVHQVACPPLLLLRLSNVDKVPKQLRSESAPVGNVDASLHDVVAHASRDDRVLLILGMLEHLLPEPRSRSEQGPGRPLAHKLEVSLYPVPGGPLASNLVEVPPDAVVEPKQRHPAVPIDDLVQTKLRHVRNGLRLGLSLANGADVASDPELLRDGGPPLVRPLHVLVHARHGHVEVEALGLYRPCEEEAVDGEGRVLKVCKVHFHRAELHPPVDDVLVHWGGLEPHCVPVCALDVLKVVVIPLVVLLQLGVKDNEGVPDEEVSNVRCEAAVEPRVLEPALRSLVDGARYVVELITHQIALADETVD
mmetsp:Transcript_22028/g.51262  ORF Transcript_22028/g.51262 Transcript_22028/m.51262 type:complete len:322 (-) Transcript_22028:1086-2051(-)